MTKTLKQSYREHVIDTAPNTISFPLSSVYFHLSCPPKTDPVVKLGSDKGEGSNATKKIYPPEQIISKVRDVLTILNRVRDPEMEDYLRDKLSRAGLEPIGVVREEPSLTVAWLKGTPWDGLKLRESAETIIKALENAESMRS